MVTILADVSPEIHADVVAFLHVVESVVNNLILDVIIVKIKDVKESVVEHAVHVTVETVVENVVTFLHRAMFPMFNRHVIFNKVVVDMEIVIFPTVINAQDLQSVRFPLEDQDAIHVTKTLVFA